MFKTFEELKEKYPIGTKLNYSKTEYSQNFFFARPEDLIEYRKEYKKVEIIGKNTVKCTWDVKDYELVSGYIFDGKSWWPAEVTWDGWIPIHEEEEEIKE